MFYPFLREIHLDFETANTSTGISKVKDVKFLIRYLTIAIIIVSN